MDEYRNNSGKQMEKCRGEANQTKSGKRKIWINVAAVLLAALVCLCAGGFFYAKNLVVHTISNSPYGLNISLYDGADSRGFSWWTSSGQESFLLISKTPFNAEIMYEQRAYTIIDDGAEIDEGVYLFQGNSRSVSGETRLDNIFSVEYVNHTVSVDNLQNNQSYYYAVGGNNRFLSGNFTTESDNLTTVCNFNDFQTSDGSKLYYGAKTLSAFEGLPYEELDFYAFGGDFSGVFSIDSKRYNKYLGWMKSRESLSEAVDSIPFVMARGNHDLLPHLFEGNNYVAYADDVEDAFYYSFDYNNIHFAVVDSNNFSLEQQTWLKQDLLAAEAGDTVWKVVMVHNGPYTTGDHGFNCEDDYVKSFSNICSQYKVDLVMQAHDHTYSKTYPYLWGTDGYYEDVGKAEKIVNFSPQEIEVDGIIYDYQPNGTYYVSCGASGHRIGENEEYASSTGEKSYVNRGVKIAIGQIKVDSAYAKIGENSSADLGLTMFGLLQVNNDKLTYSFYAVNEQGAAVLYDRLAVMK
jgi:3',5'-cyclic AMP phosphodiesterase CpdA